MSTVHTTGNAPGTAVGSGDQQLQPGQEVGEYRIESVLGVGGFGTVYGAVHPLIGKRAAIKVLARKYSADQDVVSRFVAEARAVNQIRHRNIIDIFSFGQLPDGRQYYVMEYLDGSTLDTYLQQHGTLTLDEALPILRAIARALDAAHAKGIAHRDLKPENIFIAQDPDGDMYPKLLDFGIAKLLAPDDDVVHRTGTGVPIGTPYYMSPEQCRGKDVDHRTDIYSFGIVAYRLLTGTFPFEGDDYVELLFKQVNEEPPRPSSRKPQLPASVDDAIAWMMQKDPAKRPPTVHEAVLALDPNATHTPSMPPRRISRPSAFPPGARQVTPDALAATTAPDAAPAAISTLGAPKRKRGGLVLILALLVLGGGGAAAYVATRSSSKPTTPPPPAPTKPDLAAHQPAVPIDAAVAAASPVDAVALSPNVLITITGVPDGTEVLLAGNTIGVTPTPVELPRSTSSMVLVLKADNYQPATVTVVPDGEKSVAGKLKKKASGHQTGNSRDDLESPFKGHQ